MSTANFAILDYCSLISLNLATIRLTCSATPSHVSLSWDGMGALSHFLESCLPSFLQDREDPVGVSCPGLPDEIVA